MAPLESLDLSHTVDLFLIRRGRTTKAVTEKFHASRVDPKPSTLHLHLLTSGIRSTAETSDRLQKDRATPYPENGASLARTHGNHGTDPLRSTSALFFFVMALAGPCRQPFFVFCFFSSKKLIAFCRRPLKKNSAFFLDEALSANSSAISACLFESSSSASSSYSSPWTDASSSSSSSCRFLLLSLLLLVHLGLLLLPFFFDLFSSCSLSFFDFRPTKRASDTTLERLSTNVLSLSLSRCDVSAMTPSEVVSTAVPVGGCARRCVEHPGEQSTMLAVPCRVEKSGIADDLVVRLQEVDCCCVTPCSTALGSLVYGGRPTSKIEMSIPFFFF